MTGFVIPFFGLQRQYEKIKSELLDVTNNVLKSGTLMDGFYTNELENYLSLRLGAYAITCHSCTQALEMVAIYIKQHTSRPKAFIPNFTYPATANAFINTGYDIELVDTNEFGIINFEKATGTADVGVVVGLFGKKPEVTNINNNTRFKWLVYDGAQHWLSLTKKSHMGFATTISFDPTKNLSASGNGGAVITYDQGLMDFVREYRSNGKPMFKQIGTNSRMSEIDCSHVLTRSRYIDEWQIKRQKIATYWNQQFKELPLKSLCDLSEPNAIQKYVIYSGERQALRNHLTVAGIETKITYDKPLSEMLAYRDYSNPTAFSTSYMLSKGVLALPIYPELHDNEIEYIADKVKEFYK